MSGNETGVQRIDCNIPRLSAVVNVPISRRRRRRKGLTTETSSLTKRNSTLDIEQVARDRCAIGNPIH